MMTITNLKWNGFPSYTGFSKRIFLCQIFALCVLATASCSTKREVPADPKLVEAFMKVENTLNAGRATPEAPMGYADTASFVVEELIKELGLQSNKYTGAQQKADLHKVTIELGELFGHATGLGYNPSVGQREGFYQEWRAYCPKLRPFVGPAADAPQGGVAK